MEPIRVFGDSVLYFIESISDGSAYNRYGYGVDINEEWYHLSDYIRNNFKAFLEDVIDDYLDREIPNLLHAGRYQIAINARVDIPNDFAFQRHPTAACPNEYPIAYHTVSISISSNHFRSFRIEYPAPYEDTLFRPHYLLQYIQSVGSFLLDHVHNDRRNSVIPRHTIYHDDGFRWATWRPARETEEQKQARKEKEAEARRSQQKAFELLMSQCTDKQQKDYRAHEWFIIRGASGTKYRIRKASQINIDVLNRRNKVQYKLCTVAAEFGIPIEDQLLAQKTMIELNEKEFLEIAKRWSA